MPTTNVYDFAAGIRSDGVQNATGRDWQGWFTLLDQIGAGRLTREELRHYLEDQIGLSGWWSRIVTTGYEQARGKGRIRLQTQSFAIQKARSFDVPVSRLYRAWVSERLRSRWLPGHPLLIRKAVPDRSMRITWSDGRSGVNVSFTETGPGQSEVHVQHVHLGSAREADDMKAFWTNALNRLTALQAHDDESAIDL